MKKIALILYNLDSGGAEKLALDYLKLLKNDFDLEVICFRNDGFFKQDFYKEAKIRVLTKNIFQYALFRFIPRYQKYLINKIQKEANYDVVVGYMEGRATTIASYVDGARKIGWIHIDTQKYDIGISDEEALASYKQLDDIVCVSETVKKSFLNKYGINNNVHVIYNLINEEDILMKCCEKVQKNEVFTFINVGVMREQKQQQRLVQAAKHLKDKGYKFKIQVLGNITEYGKKVIEEAISLDVMDRIDFMDFQSNPYKYIKQADCFVMSSAFEGYPVSILEALFLKVPVITTLVSGVEEMLENKYGMIVENNSDALIEGMESILSNDTILKNYSDKLVNYSGNNFSIVEQLVNLLKK